MFRVTLALIALMLVSQAASVKTKHKGALNLGLELRGLHIASETPSAATPQYYDQKVDHYDATNSKTFKQLYYVNETFWSGAANAGPIFIVLGGEGPISPAYVMDHFVAAQYAEKFGALVVGVEHRFYGQSFPVNDSTTNSLRLLSTQQALADYAAFRNFIAQKYNSPNSKWISFGGSYSGSLSAWFRMKYPHLIHGSIATSAPVLAQLNFPEYFEVVQNSIGPACAARVKRATDIVTGLLQNDTGRATLQTLFSTCDPIVSDDDVTTFMSSINDGICTIVQYNNDNVHYLPFNIDKMCEIISGTTDQEILAGYINFTNIYNKFSGSNCTDASYSKMIQEMRQTQPQSGTAAARSWTWQTCTEYGYFQTGDSNNQPFGHAITLDWFLKQCKDIFDADLTPDIAATNDVYGAKALQDSRVILPNGSVDPWHILGITVPDKCSQKKLTTEFMTGTAHCADLYPPTPNDVPDLVTTRKVTVAKLTEWLEQC